MTKTCTIGRPVFFGQPLVRLRVDDEVVCLGAGITSNTAENVTTTINPSWLDGTVIVSGEGKTGALEDNNISLIKAKWVLHGGIGYFFPTGGNVNISNLEQQGNWYHINNAHSVKDTAGRVFKMWFDHGMKPTNTNYSYIVSPGKTNQREMDNYSIAKIKVVSNTTAMQAVYELNLDILQVIFFTAGTCADAGISITVNKPCILMVKNVKGKKPVLHIADPAQEQKNIQVSLQLPGINGIKQFFVNMPQAPYLGETVKVVVE